MATIGDATGEQAVYSPPCVVRISDLNRGKGQQVACTPTGSGDANGCFTGNSADAICNANGNSPSGDCAGFGSGGDCPQFD
jgi:hypothetical protein